VQAGGREGREVGRQKSRQAKEKEGGGKSKIGVACGRKCERKSAGMRIAASCSGGVHCLHAAMATSAGTMRVHGLVVGVVRV